MPRPLAAAVRVIRSPAALDALLAALLAVASLLLGQEVFLDDGEESKAAALFGSLAALRQHVLWWWLAAVPAVVALFLRWRWPLAAFLLAGGSVLAHAVDLKLWLVGLPLLPIDLAALITLHALASTARLRRTGLLALGGAIAAHYLAVTVAIANTEVLGYPLTKITFNRPSGDGSAAVAIAAQFVGLPALLLAIAWAVGDNVRTHRLRHAESERRVAAARREQEERAAAAVAAERSRITRELHDVVAHGLSVMVVQAQAADAALRAEPDTAATALTHVIDIGRASLVEMRRLLDVVRHDTGAGPLLAPQPGVGALPALIEQVRDAGTPVSVRVEGRPVPLPAAVDLSAYRIVQEALTNTRRHAGSGASATVRLAYRDGRLEIDVADDGYGGVPTQVDGNGLRGIAERAGALGGSVDAGPRDGGGFGIRAVLPTGAPA